MGLWGTAITSKAEGLWANPNYPPLLFLGAVMAHFSPPMTLGIFLAGIWGKQEKLELGAAGGKDGYNSDDITKVGVGGGGGGLLS